MKRTNEEWQMLEVPLAEEDAMSGFVKSLAKATLRSFSTVRRSSVSLCSLLRRIDRNSHSKLSGDSIIQKKTKKLLICNSRIYMSVLSFSYQSLYALCFAKTGLTLWPLSFPQCAHYKHWKNELKSECI